MKALYRLLYYLSILLTSILAGFTLAGAFAGDASPEGFKLMPFIGLVLPILLLANVASAIYWTVRWRCWVFIPLIAILGNCPVSSSSRFLIRLPNRILNLRF